MYRYIDFSILPELADLSQWVSEMTSRCQWNT